MGAGASALRADLSVELGKVPLNGGGLHNPVGKCGRPCTAHKTIVDFALEAVLEHGTEAGVSELGEGPQAAEFRCISIHRRGVLPGLENPTGIAFFVDRTKDTLQGG